MYVRPNGKKTNNMEKNKETEQILQLRYDSFINIHADNNADMLKKIALLSGEDVNDLELVKADKEVELVDTDCFYLTRKGIRLQNILITSCRIVGSIIYDFYDIKKMREKKRKEFED
jgi:hypothetical protein